MEWREERGRRRDDEVQSEGAARFLPVALQPQLTPRVKTVVTRVAPRTRGGGGWTLTITGNKIMTVICCTALSNGFSRPPPLAWLQLYLRSMPITTAIVTTSPATSAAVHAIESCTSAGHSLHNDNDPRRNQPGWQIAQSIPVLPFAQYCVALLPPTHALGTGQV